jgi:mannuronan 5-epimerase
MRTIPHRLPRLAGAALLATVGLVAVGSPAQAASCSSPVRYASSSNTVYLVKTQSFTLSDIKAACAAAPLTLVDAASKTWELSADLVVQNGATLVLNGDGAGGDVNTLRLRSLADNLPTHVSAVTALYGTITIKDTHITSWDDDTGSPDTDPSLPAGAASTDRGRAFIRALSYLDSDGTTPHESTMTIANSELDHLGYYASEAYGVAYKTRGCDHTTANIGVCRKVQVSGSETGSHFHDDFMGTYTWGATGMTFRSNEYDHNVMYGLDTHDVSTYLSIDRNHFHDNGDHGVICSQACDHLSITNNESDHNGMVPFRGPTGDADTAGQVHGIMIHRGVTNTVVSGNSVHDEPNGAGIAIFDSAGDTVTNNTIARARYGIRISVGSSNNTITNNKVKSSTQYGIFMYKGTDPVTYTTASGHPTANSLSNNTVTSTISNALWLSEADGNQFSGSSFTGTAGPLVFEQSAHNVLSNVTLPSGQPVRVSGSSTEPGSLTIADPSGPVSVTVDSNSSYDVTSASGQLYAVGGVAASVSPGGSVTHLTSTVLHSTASVRVTPQKVSVVPASGSASASATGTGTATDVTVSDTPGGTFAISIGGLTPGVRYVVGRNGAQLTTAVADAGGVVLFSDAPAANNTFHYRVSTS